MRSNRGILGTAAVASAAVMLFGMCAFAADADTITDNKKYIAVANNAESNLDSLVVLEDVAKNNNVYIENVGDLLCDVVSLNAKTAIEQIERIEKAEKKEAEKKAKKEAAKKKKAEEQKKKEAEEKAAKEAEEKKAAEEAAALKAALEEEQLKSKQAEAKAKKEAEEKAKAEKEAAAKAEEEAEAKAKAEKETKKESTTKSEKKSETKKEIKKEVKEDTTEQESAKEETKEETKKTSTMNYDPNNCLNTFSGVFYGPSGKETYYNLDMSGVISIMRNAGYSEDEYPYWVREDGCKMLGDYIMIACNLDLRPRGTLVETSLGTGIVCDTSSVFVGANVKQIDVAVTW